MKIYDIVWRKSKASSKAERSVCTWVLNIAGSTSDASKGMGIRLIIYVNLIIDLFR